MNDFLALIKTAFCVGLPMIFILYACERAAEQTKAAALSAEFDAQEREKGEREKQRLAQDREPSKQTSGWNNPELERRSNAAQVRIRLRQMGVPEEQVKQVREVGPAEIQQLSDEFTRRAREASK